MKIELPRISAGEDHAQLSEWLVAHGSPVTAGQPVAVAETTKSCVEIVAPCDGYLEHHVPRGAQVEVGAQLGAIGIEPPGAGGSVEERADAANLVTAPARALMLEAGLDASHFAHLPVVRRSDVEAFLAERARSAAARPEGPRWNGEALDRAADWDAVLSDPRLQDLTGLVEALRKRMRARFDRHVPTGDLLHDRWALARAAGFGEGSSVYDTTLILGAPEVGRGVWVGPFAVLDAAHAPLRIGDGSSIGSGAQVYTHNTIARTLSGRTERIFHRPTTIGERVFVAPLAVVGPGSEIGDGSFVAAGSYVEGSFQPGSYIAGVPGKRLGAVKLVHGRVALDPDG